MAKKKLIFGFTADNWGNFDWFLFKLGILLFAFFLISVIPALARWVTSTHWGWFFGPFVVIWVYIVPKAWKK